MATFLPKTGDLFARAGNDGNKALVVSAERPMDGGYLCYVLLIRPDWSPVSMQMAVILPTDNHICIEFPLPEVARLAKIRAEQMKTDAPELCECGCEVAPDGSHDTACQCCPDCGEYPCICRKQDDCEDDRVIDTRWYGWLKK